jgi:ketosteroid isomerase-like protein
MRTARDTAQTFADLINTGRGAEIFDLLGPASKYVVIGNTSLSGTYVGRQAVLDNVGTLLATFRDGPNVTCHAVIADGDRAVVLASGKGVGPTGPFDQPHYAWVFDVRDGEIVELIEFLDTVTLATGALGKKLVDA